MILSRRRLMAAAAALALPIPAGQAAIKPEWRADLTRVEGYFNGIRSLTGRFLQIGPDGQASEGKIWMRRPGRFRFEYDPPSPLLIVSDGTYIVMEDRQLKSVERVPLGSTPLDLLVRETVSFDNRSDVRRVERGAAVLRITIADPEKPRDGTLTLQFGDKPLEFAGWSITDSQGLVTQISLSKLDFNPDLSASLFSYGSASPQQREIQRRR